ncbi:hypothetical protein KY343_05780 [Candidatus Woesearchaeota archaeon]|nr:hypothetical protein [Candidatus Woesearchaeota archaeon]
MKKLIFLIIFLITVSSVCASTVSIQIPFRYKYGPYNDTHTYFELINRINSYPYKLVSWPNGSSDDPEWDFTYHFDTEEVCNDTCNCGVTGTSGYNWSEDLYNMSHNLELMIETFNETNNLTQEFIASKDLIEDLGRCRGRIEELDNSSKLMLTEKEAIQNELNHYRPFENQYNTCQSELREVQDEKTTAYGIGFAIGAGLIYIAFGRKKQVEETDEVME